MDPMLIGIIIEGVAVLGLLIAVIVLGVKLSQTKKPSTKADNVKIVDGVRYTTNANEFNDNGSAVITHREGDVILERGVTYTATKGGAVIPGKYTILSASENADAFNVRIGGFVREIRHAADIVLAEGDEICAVSHTAILR